MLTDSEDGIRHKSRHPRTCRLRVDVEQVVADGDVLLERHAAEIYAFGPAGGGIEVVHSLNGRGGQVVFAPAVELHDVGDVFEHVEHHRIAVRPEQMTNTAHIAGPVRRPMLSEQGF